jgi:hypothetical protein
MLRSIPLDVWAAAVLALAVVIAMPDVTPAIFSATYFATWACNGSRDRTKSRVPVARRIVAKKFAPGCSSTRLDLGQTISRFDPIAYTNV